MVSPAATQRYTSHVNRELEKLQTALVEENNQNWIVRLFSDKVWTPTRAQNVTSYIKKGLTLDEALREVKDDETELELLHRSYEPDEDAKTLEDRPLSRDYETGRYYIDDYKAFKDNRLRNPKLDRSLNEIFADTVKA